MTRLWDTLRDWLDRRSREVAAAGVAALFVVYAIIGLVAVVMSDGGDDRAVGPLPRAEAARDEEPSTTTTTRGGSSASTSGAPTVAGATADATPTDTRANPPRRGQQSGRGAQSGTSESPRVAAGRVRRVVRAVHRWRATVDAVDAVIALHHTTAVDDAAHHTPDDAADHAPDHFPAAAAGHDLAAAASSAAAGHDAAAASSAAAGHDAAAAASSAAGGRASAAPPGPAAAARPAAAAGSVARSVLSRPPGERLHS